MRLNFSSVYCADYVCECGGRGKGMKWLDGWQRDIMPIHQHMFNIDHIYNTHNWQDTVYHNACYTLIIVTISDTHTHIRSWNMLHRFPFVSFAYPTANMPAARKTPMRLATSETKKCQMRAHTEHTDDS